MKKHFLSLLLTLSVMLAWGQKGSFLIGGSDNITAAVRQSFSAIPYLKAGPVSGDFQHYSDIHPNGMHFYVKGRMTLNYLDVTMPDGKVFRYDFDVKNNGFRCKALPQGYVSIIQTTHLAVAITGAQGMGMSLTPASGTQTFPLYGEAQSNNPYGTIPHEKLNAYGLTEYQGKRVYTGQPKEVSNILAVKPYVSVTCGGLAQTAIDRLKKDVEWIRDAYTRMNQQQAAASKPASKSPSSGGSGGITLTSTKLPSAAKSSSSSAQKSSAGSSANKSATQAKKASTTSGSAGSGTKKTYQDYEAERRAYQRQQQEKLQQAVNPGAYYMQKSGATAYFDAQIAKINREQAAKNAREEREWQATQRRRRAEQVRKEREAAEWKRNNIARHQQGRDKRKEDYNAKGGDANYTARFNQWKTLAVNGIAQVNKFLVMHKGQKLPYSYPQNSCDYVKAIVDISNSAMPDNHKVILIGNVLTLRNEYYRFYIDNAFIYNEWDVGYDDLSRSVQYGPCGNYLNAIASSAGFSKYGSFGRAEEYMINNTAYKSGYAFWEKGNYKIPMGMLPVAASYKDEAKKLGLTMHPSHLTIDEVWLKFHRKPFNWSRGPERNMKEASYGYSDGINYTSKILWSDPVQRKAEIDKYLGFYDLKRKFSLNAVEDEVRMMFFNYHVGKYRNAYDHFMRYVVLSHGGMAGFMAEAKRGLKIPLLSYDERTGIAYHVPLLGAVLFMETAQYDKALQLLNALQSANAANKSTYLHTPRAVNEAIARLTNQIYYRKGEYGKMHVLKDEAQVKAAFKSIDRLFDPIVPSKGNRTLSSAEQRRLQGISKKQFLDSRDYHLQAFALIKQGNTKLAKKVMAPICKYYKKNGPFYGSQTDIDAFKEVMDVLYAGDKDRIQYKLSTGYDIFNKVLDTYSKGPSKDLYLKTNNLESPDYINTTPVDLSANAEWKAIAGRLSKHDGSRQMLTGLYDDLSRLYHTGRIEKNKEAGVFFTAFIQIGLALGKFHETLPLIAEYRDVYEGKGLVLEGKLLQVMWPQRESAIVKNAAMKEFFEKELGAKPEYKSALKMYTGKWSNFGIFNPGMAYLYELL